MSFFRTPIFMVKGLKEFTKGGYASASKDFNPSDLDLDLKERSFMITGANSGIGKSTALSIAQKGGTIHMVCRSKERGEEARKEIVDATGNDNVVLHLLDMSKPREVLKFAKDFEQSGKPLNVLINNAGCMVNTREVTEDGFEKNFATNTLGTHVLTKTLIPVLSKGENSRVIIVSSGGMLLQKLNLDDLQFEKMKPFDGQMAYAQNKRQQVIMAEKYAEQYPNIHFSTMHPGWADTPAVRTSMPDFHQRLKSRLRTPEEGADTLIWLAVSEAALKKPSGGFFFDRNAVSKHLPLAWTKSTAQEHTDLMSSLDIMMAKFQQ